MGVIGLWKLVDAVGKPVPVETLEDKVIVIDISIWLHQVTKGLTDGKGGQIQNSHLVGLFNRICKLLYFRIKPIFVFDGKVCSLKFDTIAKRAQQKSKLKSESEKIEQLLLQSLAKEKIIKEALGVIDTKSLSPIKRKQVQEEKDDLFKLPPDESNEKVSIKPEEEEEFSSPKKSYNFNINAIDLQSSYFKSLAPDIRHDILIDIKETRKQNTWAKLRELPVESQDFSSYQMAGLLKRRQVQVSLEEAEKEMGGKVFSLSELESLLAEDGVLDVDDKFAQRIASDEHTRFVLVRNITKSISEAKARESIKSEPQPSTSKIIKEEKAINDDDDYDLELQKAIQMSLVDEPNVCIDNVDKPVKLNEQQRKKFVGSFQSHGLVKGFMKEYGEMNDDDIHDFINETQVDTKDTQNESLTQKFPHTDKYVLYGTPEKSQSLNEGEKQMENVDKTEQDAVEDSKLKETVNDDKEIVITIESKNYSQEEDIFADIFQSEKDDTKKSPDIEIASISDDDTIEYEYSESELSQANSTKQKDLDDNDDNEDLAYTNSEKFWNQLNEIEEKYKINQAEAKEKTPERVISLEHIDKKIIEQAQETIDEMKIIKKDQDEQKAQGSTDTKIKITPEKTNNIEKNDKLLTDVQDKVDEEIPQETKICITEEKQTDAEYLRSHFTKGELVTMKDDMMRQQKDLEFERNKRDRMGTSITEKMSSECKDLLRLFGIPYIDAPTEAEAQCAFLNAAKLADGIITDDSDVWLFGAKTVYKNFFLQKKVVKKFEIEDIEQKLKLDRKKLIQLAMLVGSDYTIGIHGVGAVTALEILAAFPPTPEELNQTDIYQSSLSSLRKFRDWFENRKQDNQNNFKSLKSKLKNIEIISGFPSLNVVKAYLEPNVDKSLDDFSWGVPDEESIHEFTKYKLGWTRMKTKEILDPVLKRFKERKQKKMEDYFSVQMKKRVLGSPKLSKRVKNAIIKMSENDNNEEDAPTSQKQADTKKPRKRNSNKKVLSLKDKKEIQTIQETCSLLSEDENEEPAEKKKSLAQNKFSPTKESIQKISEQGKINAFEVIKSKKTTPATQKSRKRKSKESEPKPSTSKVSNTIKDKEEESLPWKRTLRIPETKQVIPQKEKEKKEAETKKQQAIEIFKNAKNKERKKMI